MRALIACATGAIVGMSLAGCEAPAPAMPPAAPMTVDLSELFATRRAAQTTHDPHAVPAHLNSPRSAAQELATRGRPLSMGAQRTVNLHAALYRAAIDADPAEHPAYLLNPIEDEQAAPPEAMGGREFRLRVLSRFIGTDEPVMWDAPALTWMFDERAPGGPAALAWFEIIREHAELASVEADVCIESPHVGTRRSRVEAIYDGERWNVRDLGARTTW